MVLKKPKQGASPTNYRPKEMLLLQVLSASAAEKFIEAMQQAAVKVRYTGSPYHRSAGSKAGPIAPRAGLASRCPPNWTNVDATRVLRAAIVEGRVSMQWE